MKDWAYYVLFSVLLLIPIAIAIWIKTSAPCSWLSWQSSKEVPARCYSNFESDR